MGVDKDKFVRDMLRLKAERKRREKERLRKLMKADKEFDDYVYKRTMKYKKRRMH